MEYSFTIDGVCFTNSEAELTRNEEGFPILKIEKMEDASGYRYTWQIDKITGFSYFVGSES